MDPDQTAPLGAVWSGYIVFVSMAKVYRRAFEYTQQMCKADNILWTINICEVRSKYKENIILQEINYNIKSRFKLSIIIWNVDKVNVLKFQTFFIFCSQIKSCVFSGWKPQNTCQNSKQGRPWNAYQNSKQGRPWSDCFFISRRSSLIWVCTVCLALFGWQLVFPILEHLP